MFCRWQSWRQVFSFNIFSCFDVSNECLKFKRSIRSTWLCRLTLSKWSAIRSTHIHTYETTKHNDSSFVLKNMSFMCQSIFSSAQNYLHKFTFSKVFPVLANKLFSSLKYSGQRSTGSGNHELRRRHFKCVFRKQYKLKSIDLRESSLLYHFNIFSSSALRRVTNATLELLWIRKSGGLWKTKVTL